MRFAHPYVRMIQVYQRGSEKHAGEAQLQKDRAVYCGWLWRYPCLLIAGSGLLCHCENASAYYMYTFWYWE